MFFFSDQVHFHRLLCLFFAGFAVCLVQRRVHLGPDGHLRIRIRSSLGCHLGNDRPHVDLRGPERGQRFQAHARNSAK